MTARRYTELQEVVLDPSFPDLDLALRRGRHIDREDFAWYTLLTDAQEPLETFYRRYGCELVHKTDGYYYLLPTGEKLSRRQLAPGDMLVGQALALMYLDPSTIERGGRVTTEDVVAQLAVVLGAEALVRAFHTKKKRYDERVAQKAVRTKVADGIRHLEALGFVEVGDESQLRLRPALLRFAEPVRGLGQPAAALAKLVADGEIALVTEEPAIENADSVEDVEGVEDVEDVNELDEPRPDDDEAE
ncbi:MAG: chromosome partition protein MukE [Kofleriaceae bacterium]